MLTPKTASKQMRNLFATPEPEPQPAAAPNKEGGRECIDDPNKDEPTKGTSLRPKQFERRIIAEIDLENVLPWHMEPDTAYHCFSYGRIDSIAFLRAILKQQPLEYLLIQTWYLSTSHLDEIKKWVEQGLIKHLDFYVGEVFKYKYIPVYLAIKDIVCSRGGALWHIAKPRKNNGRFWRPFRLRYGRIGKLQHQSTLRANCNYHQHRPCTLLQGASF
jgi:hypothetical protein